MLYVNEETFKGLIEKDFIEARRMAGDDETYKQALQEYVKLFPEQLRDNNPTTTF